MSPESDAPPPPASEPTRARSRFWIRWGSAAVVLAALAVYGAFLEGGAPPVQEADEPNGAAADDDADDRRNADDERGAEQPEGLEPEASPEDHAPPDASARPHAVFDAVVHAGSGPDRVRTEVPDGQPAIMNVTHEGAGSFALEARDRAGATDLVVETTGTYAGTRSVNLGEVVEHYHELAIEADGDWTIEVLPLSAATQVEDGVASGRGDDVVLISAGGRGRFSHEGQAEVMVVEYRGSELFAGLTLVDEVGAHDGAVRITEDTGVLVITADGAWELSMS